MTRLITLLIAVSLLAGCGKDSRYLHHFELNESTFDSDAMKEISRDTGLTIPAGSRGLNFVYDPPIDPAFLARIEIPPKSKDAILAQFAPLHETEMNPSEDLTKTPSWWRPHAGKVILDKQTSKEKDGFYLLHGILSDEGGKLILYLDYST